MSSQSRPIPKTIKAPTAAYPADRAVFPAGPASPSDRAEVALPLGMISKAWILFILVCAVAGGAAGYYAATTATPSYSSSVTVLISPRSASGTGVEFSQVQVVQSLADTYAELAGTEAILDPVIKQTGVDITSGKLSGAVTSHVPANTSLLRITVASDDAAEAAVLANGIAEELAGYPLFGGATAARPAVLVTVVDPATPSTSPQNLGPLSTAGIGAFVGLLIGIGFAYVIESLRRMRRDGASA